LVIKNLEGNLTHNPSYDPNEDEEDDDPNLDVRRETLSLSSLLDTKRSIEGTISWNHTDSNRNEEAAKNYYL